jgi:hypothetical protein
MGYLFPFPRSVRRSQDFGANPGWGPNPPGGHNGDDWAVPVGTPVRAAGDGVVVFAGQFDDTYADNWGWNLMYGGNMVILNMDGETAPYFEYGHNSELRVREGDRVKRGQVISLSGNSDGGTNVSTGPHCHVGCLPYNFNLNTNTYGRVNPRLFMTDYWDDEAGTASLGPAGEITTTPTEEDDMFTDNDRALLTAVNEAIFKGGQSTHKNKSLNNMLGSIWDAIFAGGASMPGGKSLSDILGKVASAPAATVDTAALAASIAESIPADLAQQVADELGKRLQGGN